MSFILDWLKNCELSLTRHYSFRIPQELKIRAILFFQIFLRAYDDDLHDKFVKQPDLEPVISEYLAEFKLAEGQQELQRR